MPAFQVNTKWAALSEVVPDLYICGVSALQPDILLKLGVTCIINCTVEVPNLNRQFEGMGVDRIKLWLEDSVDADISEHLRNVPDQIEMVRRDGGKALVHCVAGVSRSAAVVLAYLLKYHFKSLRESYHYLSSKRAMVRPNLGFWHQLIELELELKGRTSVRIVRGHSLLGGNVTVTDTGMMGRSGSSCSDSGCGSANNSDSEDNIQTPGGQFPDVYLPIMVPPSDQKPYLAPRFTLFPSGMGESMDESTVPSSSSSSCQNGIGTGTTKQNGMGRRTPSPSNLENFDSSWGDYFMRDNQENTFDAISDQEKRERKTSGASLKFVPSLETLEEGEP